MALGRCLASRRSQPALKPHTMSDSDLPPNKETEEQAADAPAESAIVDVDAAEDEKAKAEETAASGEPPPDEETQAEIPPDTEERPTPEWKPLSAPRLARDIAAELSWPPIRDRAAVPPILYVLVALIVLLLLVAVLVGFLVIKRLNPSQSSFEFNLQQGIQRLRARELVPARQHFTRAQNQRSGQDDVTPFLDLTETLHELEQAWAEKDTAAADEWQKVARDIANKHFNSIGGDKLLRAYVRKTEELARNHNSNGTPPRPAETNDSSTRRAIQSPTPR